jgi:cell division protein FtsQ|tara:strand:- start:1917 stop:2711 length:795 start_codon:yes stop_codon:yes gene_type:complete
MKPWLKIALISLSSIVLVMLLAFMYKAQNETVLALPKIIIHVEGESSFLTETELVERLQREKLIYPGQTFKNLNIHSVERFIEAMPEVKDVKAYSKIGANWSIDVELRVPIARIFNQYGETYYLDREGHTMHPSSAHTARVVVVNGFIPDKLNSPPVAEIINNDSLKSIRKLDDVYRISNYVCNDPFLRAQIAQIHLRKNGEFVMTPQVGGHIIVFGTAYTDKEVSEKFDKLKVFYKHGLPYEGWNKYSEIVLKYENQIVGKKK